MFKFNYMLTEADYIEFSRYVFSNKQFGKKDMMWLRLSVPIFLLLFTIFRWFNEFSWYINPDLEYLLYGSFLSLGVAVLWFFSAKPILLWSIKKGIAGLGKAGRLPYDKENTLIFEEEAVIEITPDLEARHKYSKIEEIAEAEQAVYVFLSAASGFIMPISIFSDEGERKQFVSFVQG
ncbi:MAG: YcxB family protein, partial [Coriobacteriia bacterium]|nr:YcxB family protein [Coriobacteriia bacterium]